MTTIKTTCERCGDVELEPSDLSLELDPTEESGVYLFTCPTCIAVQRRPANPRVVNVLLATGVTFEVVTPTPVENPITESEIAAFARRLHGEEDLFRLLTS